MGDKAEDGVLPITLTEVLVLLFFVLALAFAWNARTLQAIPEPIVKHFTGSTAPLEPEPGWTVLMRCLDEDARCDPGTAEVLAEVAASLGIDASGLTPSEVGERIRDQIVQARAVADTILQDRGLDPTPARQPTPFPDLVTAFRGQVPMGV